MTKPVTYKMSEWLYSEGQRFNGRSVKGVVRPFVCGKVLKRVEREGLHAMLTIEIHFVD